MPSTLSTEIWRLSKPACSSFSTASGVTRSPCRTITCPLSTVWITGTTLAAAASRCFCVCPSSSFMLMVSIGEIKAVAIAFSSALKEGGEKIGKLNPGCIHVGSAFQPLFLHYSVKRGEHATTAPVGKFGIGEVQQVINLRRGQFDLRYCSQALPLRNRVLILITRDDRHYVEGVEQIDRCCWTAVSSSNHTWLAGSFIAWSRACSVRPWIGTLDIVGERMSLGAGIPVCTSTWLGSIGRLIIAVTITVNKKAEKISKRGVPMRGSGSPVEALSGEFCRESSGRNNLRP